MSNQAACNLNIGARPMGSAMSACLRRAAILYTLLLSLVLSGIVPHGFMRSADSGGMALVLCSSDGPIEAWLSADGELLDAAPTDAPSSELTDCLAITLSLVLMQAWYATIAQPVEFSPYLVTYIDRRSALVPALTPLQPRAPPVLT